MRKVSVVIGANYGDEGKGITTDWLSNQDTLVVRFNGGAQAGHTVVSPDGKRHVFSHFGSGTFRDAKTLLSPFFVVNPIMFRKEYKRLNKQGIHHPRVYVDLRCPVSTYIDMMINQAIEKQRGTDKHGSCGLGFGETLERNGEEIFSMRVADLLDVGSSVRKLNEVIKYYLPYRMQSLGLKTIDPMVSSHDLMKRWLEDVQFFLSHVAIVDCEASARNYKGDIVFEGAQGLQLDQDHKHFPHVTRSKTGLFNVGLLAQLANIAEPVNVHYVTRTYLTRHGAGPLANELGSDLPYPKVKDDTNVKNAFQDHLRFAYLDLQETISAIRHDLRQAPFLNLQPNLVVTHADQLEDNAVRYFEDGEMVSKPLGVFLQTLGNSIEARQTFVSFGNTRNSLGSMPS